MNDIVPGKLIVIEGKDGVGKYTQAMKLAETMRSLVISYPNYDFYFGKILKEFLDGNITISPLEQMLLYVGDMVAQQGVILDNLKEGTNVILDRYYFSSYAYQVANGLKRSQAIDIISGCDLLRPDAFFLLTSPSEITMERKKKQKETPDKFEKNKKLMDSVEEEYFGMICAIEDCVSIKPSAFIIDGSKSIDAVHQDIASKFTKHINEQQQEYVEIINTNMSLLI